MASAFTPSTVKPPAPKKSAWRSSTSDSQTKATPGLYRIARMATPVRCAEVPPGTGIMSPCTTKASAVREPTTGRVSVAEAPKFRRTDQYQSGAAAPQAGR